MSTFLLLLVLLSGQTAWTSARSRPEAILEGTWQSCPDNEDGSYGERIFARRWKNKLQYEIHMGPRDEFAVFAFDTPEGDVPHGDPQNLLTPAYHFDDVQSVTGRNWHVASLGLHLNVTKAGGSYENCYTYFVVADQDQRQLADR